MIISALFKWHKILIIFFLIIFFAIILLNSAPFWSGKIFAERTLEQVPSYWNDIANYLNTDQSIDRIIVTPAVYASVYNWGTPASSVARALVKKSIIEVEKADYGYKRFNRLLVNSVKNPTIFSFILKIGNIKYIIQRNDIDASYYENTDKNEQMKKYLNDNEKLEYINDFGKLSLYRVKEAYIMPRLYIPNNINYIQGDLETNIESFSFDNEKLKSYLTESGANFISNNKNLDSNNDYLLDKLNNIILPIGLNNPHIVELKKAIELTKINGNTPEITQLQTKLDIYSNAVAIDDFHLIPPIAGKYNIYLRPESITDNHRYIRIIIDDNELPFIKQDETNHTNGWLYLNQVELTKADHLIKIFIGDNKLQMINPGDIVFTMQDIKPEIKTPTIEYRQINPTKYIINVHSAPESFPLILSESFYDSWKMYVRPELSSQGTGKFIGESNHGTIQNDNLDSTPFYDNFFAKPVFDKKHFMINGYANAWWIDLPELEKQGLIKKNNDGTYDFSVTIEFTPQKYFYIGLFISCLTFIGCIAYLIWDFLKRRKEQLLLANKTRINYNKS